jgi:hypothetical protein
MPTRHSIFQLHLSGMISDASSQKYRNAWREKFQLSRVYSSNERFFVNWQRLSIVSEIILHERFSLALILEIWEL